MHRDAMQLNQTKQGYTRSEKTTSFSTMPAEYVAAATKTAKKQSNLLASSVTPDALS